MPDRERSRLFVLIGFGLVSALLGTLLTGPNTGEAREVSPFRYSSMFEGLFFIGEPMHADINFFGIRGIDLVGFAGDVAPVCYPFCNLNYTEVLDRRKPRLETERADPRTEFGLELDFPQVSVLFFETYAKFPAVLAYSQLKGFAALGATSVPSAHGAFIQLGDRSQRPGGPPRHSAGGISRHTSAVGTALVAPIPVPPGAWTLLSGFMMLAMLTGRRQTKRVVPHRGRG